MKYSIAVFVVILALFATTTLAEKHLRGVQDAHVEHYQSAKEVFQCLNQQGTVPLEHVNDEFCDCADGSDEPGSSACTFQLKKPTNWKFRCTNKGFSGKEIMHSRVNDRICDCCDGSDEYHGHAECENTCAQAAQAEEKDAAEREALRQAGLRAREQMVAKAVTKKEEKKAEVEVKKNAITAADEAIKNLQAEKDAAEVKEKAQREEIHAKSLAEKEIWENEQAAKKQKAEEEAAAQPAAAAADPATAEATTPEAAAAAPDSADDVHTPSSITIPTADSTDSDSPPLPFVCTSWRQTKHCKGDGDREPSMDKGCDEIINSGDSGYCQCVDTRSGEEKKFPKDCAHKQLTCTYVCENDGQEQENLDGHPGAAAKEPETFKVDDGSSFELEEARDLRRRISELENQKSTDVTDVEALEKFVTGSYGPEDALLSLMDECVEKDDGREYTYKLCPFKEILQVKRGGHGGTNMGRWKGWGEQTYGAWGGKQDYSRMIFDSGDHCYSAGARQTEVHVVCGPESKLTLIEEPSMCKYKMVFETPGVCE